MTYINYYNYINSQAWKDKKREYYSSKMYKTLSGSGKWKCYCCERNDVPLDLHHRTYKRLGNERINVDLVPVCRSCHDEIHTRTRNGQQLWSATKAVRKKYARKKRKAAKRS